ncbi:hypothetical protein FGRMN_6487 [Fusarium graminum]|nr:hypothetical protein FGRMN_6487 [Fusarium graminum]
MPRDHKSDLTSLELVELEQDVSQKSHYGPRRDRHYSPLDGDAFNDTTPAREGKARTCQSESATALVTGRTTSGKQSYWESFKGPEAPKKVCETGFWAILCRLALFHIPPIGITLALLGLYIREIRWGDLTEEQLNALQFAAKAHEILILVSLTDILLQRICHGLLCGDEGIPLGFLSAPFYLGSPLQYFSSWEFWAGLIQPGTRSGKKRPWITGSVIIVTIFLSVAAAPLSAIVMIPREGWWQVQQDVGEAGPSKYYLKPNIYQNDLGAEQTDRYLIKQSSSSIVNDRISLLLPMLKDVPRPQLDTTWHQLTNLSYTNYFTLYESDRPLSVTQATTNDWNEHVVPGTKLAVATRPMDIVAHKATNSWELESTKPKGLLIRSHWNTVDSPSPKKWKQPLVAVECAWNSTEGSEAYFSFTANMSNANITLSFDNSPIFKDLVTEARKLPKNDFPKVRHRFPMTGNNADSLVSGDFLFLEERNHEKWFDNGTLDTSINETHHELNVGMHLCRAYARWAEADIWIDRRRSDIVQSQLDYTLFDAFKMIGERASHYEPIKLRSEWLQLVGRRRNESSNYVDAEQSSIWEKTIDIANEIRREASWSTPELNRQYLQLIIAVHLTDILSRMTPGFIDRKGTRPDDRDDGKPPESDDYIVNHTFFQRGHGYRLRSNSTIPLALAILLLHVAVVLVHISILFFSRHRWLSSCWTSFGEVLVLALRSEKCDLGNVGGGVDSSQTWSTPAVVRAVGAEGRLEMILNRRGDGGGNVVSTKDCHTPNDATAIGSKRQRRLDGSDKYSRKTQATEPTQQEISIKRQQRERRQLTSDIVTQVRPAAQEHPVTFDHSQSPEALFKLIQEMCEVFDAPGVSQKVFALASKTYLDYTMNAPRLSHLPFLITLNVKIGIANNAHLPGFHHTTMRLDEAISPFNQQGPSQPSLKLPEVLEPTKTQREVPHHPWLDIFPFPSFRDNIIQAVDAQVMDDCDLCKDIAQPNLDNVERPSLIVWGDASLPHSWEASPRFLRKWGWLLKGCPEMLEATNKWRQSRGEKLLHWHDHTQGV